MTINKSVYLAGPISGLTFSEANGWRDAINQLLREEGIKGLNPLRADVHLRDQSGLLDDKQLINNVYGRVASMSTQRGVVTRDKFDCINCDVILVNLLGAKKVSIGTVIEIGWANANNIPIILVIEESGNCHDHSFIRECSQFRTTDIYEAAHIAIAILSDY